MAFLYLCKFRYCHVTNIDSECRVVRNTIQKKIWTNFFMILEISEEISCMNVNRSNSFATLTYSFLSGVFIIHLHNSKVNGF